MAWWTLAVLLLSLSIVCCAESIQEFTSSTLINNVVQDPLTGHIYVGAINAIYQLDSLLRQEKKVETGPKRDSRHCTPPIQSCHDAKMTDNTNKLLLVHPSNGSLIVCGSLFKGICSLRKLGSIDHLIYCNDSKGEKAYVVSSEETVSVVGVMSTFTKENDTFDVFVVGKGYGSQGNMKLISTRILQDFGNWDVFEDIVEAPAVQVTPFVKKYRHNFRYSFKESGFIYFLFTRTRGGLHNKNYTFISRLCEDDHHYYSYMELQLSCGPNNMYNKAQAAFVSSPGEELARNLSASGQYGQVRSQDKILFVVSSTDEDKPRSGLCMYPLRYINQRIMEIISACYTKNGKIGNKVAVDSPYTTSANLLYTLTKYKCSADFLPSPLASTPGFALAAQAVHTTRDLLMAVAVAVEAEHTVAFLGTSNGKVHLSSTPEVYRTVPGPSSGEAVNKHLLFDRNHRHLYVTTGKKVPSWEVDCISVAHGYPFCCRCTRKSDCRKAEEEKHWLWSPQNQCVEITSFQPPNLSCKKMQKVDINVASLPSIGGDDSLKCIFGNFESEAKMGDSKVTCDLPKVTEIPVTPKNKDFVQVATKIFVNDEVELASSYFTFYNCSAAARQAENTPCMSCVDSEWSCQWNTQEFICDDRDDSVGDHIIKHKEVRNECPVFENPTPSLIPVGYETSIEFTGKNLRVYEVKDFSSYLPHRMLMLLFLRSRDQFAYDEVRTVDVHFYIKDRKTHKKIDSKLNVTLYNCAVGREDCSLCKSADPMYSCVWCDKTKSCEYRKRCPSGERRRDCPNPEITDIIPQYGPLKGGISVTIKGSNLGIVKEDIESIRVAGEPCVHQEEKYFVSTSVVCEIGGVQQKQSGVVEVKVKGGKSGTSSVMFTYRDPRPERVQPNRGPRAGGTLITITGTDLETGTKDDVSITVGGVVCVTSPLKTTPSVQCLSSLLFGAVGVLSNGAPIAPAFHQYFNVCIYICCGSGRSHGLYSGVSLSLILPLQSEVEVKGENDTVMQFSSPTVNVTDGIASLRTYIVMDNIELELKPFDYHPDPTFEENQKRIVSENSIISVTGKGFAKAMTAQEAEAFVGDVSCGVSILHDDMLFLDWTQPTSCFKRPKRDTKSDLLELKIKFGHGQWIVGSVEYEKKIEASWTSPLDIIIPAVIAPMVGITIIIIIASVCCYRKQAEREYEKLRQQLENLEGSVRDRCKKEFTELMIEMEDHTADLSEPCIPFLDYKTYADRVFFLPFKDSASDVMITGKLDIPEARRATVMQALNQFLNLLNSKPFLLSFIRTLEGHPDFNAQSKGYFASLLTVALHGKLDYYTDIMRTLLLELMEQYARSKNPKLMLHRSETVVEKMLCNWMSICLYQFLKDSAGEPLYKLFKAVKHQVEKGPVDAVMKKAKYTLNDTDLLGDDVEYCTLTLQVLVHGEGPGVTLVKVLNCDTISQVTEKILEQVYKNVPYSQRPKMESVTLESAGQILSDLDLTSQKEGRWKRMNTLAHYDVRDNATLVLSRVLHPLQSYDQHQDRREVRNALLEEDKVFHLVQPAEEVDEVKSKRGNMKDKSMTKAITELYLMRLLSVKGTLQQFVDDFFRSVLCSSVGPPAVKYFFDFLDEQAQKHDNVDDQTIDIWKTSSLPLRFWVNILRNPHFIFDIHVNEVVDASLFVIVQTFMDACTKSERKLSRDSPNHKLLYAKEISTYKKMVEDYYKGIREMVPVSNQHMNTHLAKVSRSHKDKLSTQVALHQLYQYANKYYDVIITSFDEDPAAQNKQLALRLQQIVAVLENKVTDP
uniref:Sema domain-containing protein n=1 Tax=Scleropages formosus TaxID=113540 RepID=A0A8C9U8S0_SCLFO